MKNRFSLRLATAFTTIAMVIVALLIAITYFVIFAYMRPLIQGNSTAKYEQIFAQADIQLDTTLQNTVRMAASLSTDAELLGTLNLMQKSDNQTQRIQNEIHVRYLLKVAASYYPHIDNVGIYLPGYQVLMNEMQTVDYHESIPGEPWFQRLMEGEVDHAFITGYKMHKSYLLGETNPHYLDFCIYATRFSPSLNSDAHGIFLVAIDQTHIESYFLQNDYSDGRIIALFDAENRLIYTSDDAHRAVWEDAGATLAARESSTTVEIADNAYFYVSRTNQPSAWKMAALIPINTMYRDIEGLQRFFILGSALVGLLGMLLCIAMSRAVTRPFTLLMTSMDQAGSGNLGRTHKHARIWEINALFERYDNMLRRIDQLIGRIKEVEREKRTAELSALQAQINPHFTYNTLNSIQWVARLQNASKVAEMVGLFSSLLRRTTSHTEDFITVEEELAQVGCYIEIMKLRYNCDINVTYALQPDVLSCLTLKLILQPIIENSLMHGFANLSRDGHIHICVYREAEQLVMQVCDDGVGVEVLEGGLPQTQAKGGAQLHRGIGISNVNQRIQAWFGEAYGLRFESSPEAGTTVIIVQPYRQAPQEDVTD